MAAVKKFPKTPAHPERVCWGCNLYCPASDRTQHPAELFGEDWDQWELDAETQAESPLPGSADGARPRG